MISATSLPTVAHKIQSHTHRTLLHMGFKSHCAWDPAGGGKLGYAVVLGAQEM